MKITPVGDRIYIDVKEVKTIGALDVSSKKSAHEYGTVIAIGPEVKSVKKGDEIMVKAWGLDVCEMDDKQYYFVSESTNAVCAIVS